MHSVLDNTAFVKIQDCLTSQVIDNTRVIICCMSLIKTVLQSQRLYDRSLCHIEDITDDSTSLMFGKFRDGDRNYQNQTKYGCFSFIQKEACDQAIKTAQI